MKKALCTLSLVLSFCFSLWAGTVMTDFKNMSSYDFTGWELSQTDQDEGTTNPGRRFMDDGDAVTSPCFEGCVVLVSLDAKCVNMNQGAPSSLTILARCSPTDDWRVAAVLNFQTAGATNAVFSLARADDFRQFRLRFDKVSGTMRLMTFAATWRGDGEIDAPSDMVASQSPDGSLHATWPAVDGADGYKVYLWREEWKPWTGTPLWGETFAGCVNTGKNPKALEGEDLDAVADQPGWRGENLSLAAESADMIQINKASSTTGWLESAALPRMSGVTLVVRARAHTMQSDHVMPVYLVHEGVTNDCAQFELTDEMKDYAKAGLDIAEGDRLLLRSFVVGSQRRVLLDAVHFVGDDYEAGHVVTNWVVAGESVTTSEWTATGLEAEGQYRFAVRAVMGVNESEMSESVPVTLLPQEDVVAGAVALSTLATVDGRRMWYEDFSVFTNIYPKSDNVASWTNGVTVPHWQLYVGDAAPETLSRNFGTATASDFYAYWATNKVSDTYSLGTLTSGDRADLVYGVAFRNDTMGDVRQVRVRYDGLQFGFKNNVEQSLQCECLVTNEEVSVVASGDWRACDALRFTTPVVGGGGLESGKDLPVRRAYSADDLGVRVPRGGYLLIRWRRTKTTSAAAMAIDNVEMAFESAIQPTVMILR